MSLLLSLSLSPSLPLSRFIYKVAEIRYAVAALKRLPHVNEVEPQRNQILWRPWRRVSYYSLSLALSRVMILKLVAGTES